MKKILLLLLLSVALLGGTGVSVHAKELDSSSAWPDTENLLLPLDGGDYLPTGSLYEYERPNPDAAHLMRAVPSVYLNIGVAGRCDWLYVDAYKEQTKLLGTGLKVCSSDADASSLMQGRQRYVYCIEWAKTTPNGYVGITTDPLRSKAVVTCMMHGARYWGGTCPNPAFSTGETTKDYYITQMAIHICNGEFTFDQWNAQALFGLPYSQATDVYNQVAPRIKAMADYCMNPINQTDFDGNNVYQNFYLELSTASNTTWTPETVQGVAGYSSSPCSITLHDAMGLQNINEWLNQVTFTTDETSAVILRGDTPSVVWNSWRLWIPAAVFEAYSRTGKTLSVDVAGNIPGGFAGYSYFPGTSDLQKVTLLEMTTGSPHDVHASASLQIPKTGLQLCDLTIYKKIPVYRTASAGSDPIQTDEIIWSHGNPTFFFDVAGVDLLGNPHHYTRAISFTKEYVDAHTDDDGSVTLGTTIHKIPEGDSYEISERRVARYQLDAITSESVNMEIQDTSVLANLSMTPTGSSVLFLDSKRRFDQYSHNSYIKNSFSIAGK